MSVIFTPTEIEELFSYEDDTSWRAYLLPAAVKTNTITLEDSLKKYSGIYLFAIEKPVLDAQFISHIYTFLKTTYSFYQERDRCFLWLNQGGNPDAGPSYQFGQALFFFDALYSVKANSKGRSQQLWINKSSYFSVAPYSKVTLNAAADGFLIHRTHLSLAPRFDYGMYLTNKQVDTEAIALGKITINDRLDLEPPLLISFISACSAIQFELSFPFKFKDQDSYVVDHDVYPYSHPNEARHQRYTILPTVAKRHHKHKDTAVEITCNLFNNENEIFFRGSFHPGAVFNPACTYFAFKPQSSLSTAMPTRNGKTITIESLENAALLFSKFPDHNDDFSRYYWTISGDFALLNEPVYDDQEIVNAYERQILNSPGKMQQQRTRSVSSLLKVPGQVYRKFFNQQTISE